MGHVPSRFNLSRRDAGENRVAGDSVETRMPRVPQHPVTWSPRQRLGRPPGASRRWGSGRAPGRVVLLLRELQPGEHVVKRRAAERPRGHAAPVHGPSASRTNGPGSLDTGASPSLMAVETNSPHSRADASLRPSATGKSPRCHSWTSRALRSGVSMLTASTWPTPASRRSPRCRSSSLTCLRHTGQCSPRKNTTSENRVPAPVPSARSSVVPPPVRGRDSDGGVCVV